MYSDLLAKIAVEKPEPEQRTAARTAYALRIIARFEASSGAKIDEARKTALIAELQIARASHAQLIVAEQFILRVRARYGTLSLPDFDPTPEDLAQIGETFAGSAEKARAGEYNRGYQAGYDQGRIDTDREWNENAAYLAERKAAGEAVDLTARINVVLAREAALADAEKKLAKREDEIARRERRPRILGAPPDGYVDPRAVEAQTVGAAS